MFGIGRRQSVIRWAAIGAVSALVVAEASTAISVPATVGFLVCGLFAVVVALRPDTRRALPVVAAACGSAVFTVVCSYLPVRPEFTFGLTELAALGWIEVRTARRQRPWAAVALSAVLMVAAGLLPLRLGDFEDLGLKAAMGMLFGFGQMLAAVLGMYLRLLDWLRVREHERIRQEQRLEYARDLHDFVAHHVTAIVAQTKAVRFTSTAGQPPPPEALDTMLAGIEQAGSAALESMREVITVLRSDADDPARPQRTLTQVVSETITKFTVAGLPATSTLDEHLTARYLPAPIIDVAHHVLREALTNVLRHAGDVTRVDVDAHVCRDNPQRLRITVTDDGHGTTEPMLPSGGYGLTGLTERVTAASGHLTAGRDEQGWRVTALLPITPIT